MKSLTLNESFSNDHTTTNLSCSEESRNADCFQLQILPQNLDASLNCTIKKPNLDYFSILPVCYSQNLLNYYLRLVFQYELILHIFQYLDLECLRRCSEVSRSWYQATLDSRLYQNLDLKKVFFRIFFFGAYLKINCVLVVYEYTKKGNFKFFDKNLLECQETKTLFVCKEFKLIRSFY